MNNIIVDGELGEEGILHGEYGDLHFKRCTDGISIIESHFPGSGFISCPTGASLNFPSFVNDIPVTEIHHTVKINNSYPIAIEDGELKRAYLKVSSKPLSYIPSGQNPYTTLMSYLSDEQENKNPDNEFADISIDFYKRYNSVDYCEISCDKKCILSKVNAKCLKVNARSVILCGSVFRELEQAIFSGKVYPYTEDWFGDIRIYNDYFEGAKNLKKVEGSLSGKVCWSFKDCSSLEKVHLSNGISEIPPYAFYNCSSLIDIYVPDTVTEIGEYAFAGCSNLRTVHLPSDIRKIPSGLFKNCKSLTKCYLSDSIEVIESEAFVGCDSIKKPWIPKSIQTISEYAFDNPEWGKI